MLRSTLLMMLLRFAPAGVLLVRPVRRAVNTKDERSDGQTSSVAGMERPNEGKVGARNGDRTEVPERRPGVPENYNFVSFAWPLLVTGVVDGDVNVWTERRRVAAGDR